MKKAMALTLSILLCGGVSAQPIGKSMGRWKDIGAASMEENRKGGLEYIEVTINDFWRPAKTHEEIYERAEKALADIKTSGLKVWSVHLPFSRTLDISVLDDKARAENVAFMAEMIALAGRFNPRFLVLHPSSEPIGDEEREQRLRNSHASIGLLAPEARRIGATLCIENLPRTCLGRDSGEIMRLIGDFPEVMVCFDSNHLLQEEHAHFFETVGNRIGTIHASDYDRKDERHWLPGEGVIAWTDFLRRLRASGYEGVFMHEVRAGENATPANVVKAYNEVILGKKKK